MPFSHRQLRLVARAACAALLIAACSDVHRVEVQSSPTPSTKAIPVGVSVKVDLSRALASAYEKANVRTVEQAAVLLAVAKGVEAANNQVRAGQGAVHPPSAAASTSHGPHSDAWWHGVSICEQGGRNDSYFGYFSYMDGSAGGGKSWATQVAMGNRTIAQYGDHAWAASCVAAGYRASPGG